MLILDNIEFIPIQKLLVDPNRIGLPLPFIRPTLMALLNKKVLEVVQHNNFQHFGLNGEHTDWFYELADTSGLIPQEASTLEKSSSEDIANNVPASDRFVTVSDNYEAIEKAKLAITDLSDAIVESNTLFANAEERIQVSREINFIKELISEQQIHVTSVWDASKNNSTLKWLIEQSASGIVRDLATKAINALAHLLTTLL